MRTASPMTGPRQVVIRLAATLALATAGAASAAVAQVPAPDTTPVATPLETGSPVVLDRDTLFHIRVPIGPVSAAQRAATVRSTLLDLARNPFVRLDSLRIIEADGYSNIMLRDLVIASVTDADAAVAGVSRAELAQAHAETIAAALERSAVSTNIRTLLLGLLYTVLATAALVLLLRLLNHVFTRVHRLLHIWQRRRISPVRVQNLEVVSAERIGALIKGLVRLVRLVLTLLLFYVFLLLVFSFFPWTRGVAARLVNYAVEPAVSVVTGFIEYVPNLFYIVVITAVTYYVLKVIRLVFHGVETGAITFTGFYRDWAEPTYKIVRFMVIALSVILIWPHLPSSDSTAFKGVAAFLGLVLSFGSASAVANIVSGVVMVYMRPFQVGDRVRIADTVGDVVDKTLLVTRVRTTKNVDITVPNSLVLGSHIINYSSTARAGGLVLHTTITIGYDVPWRRVHELLIAAAIRTPAVMPDPPPFVLQTALNDFHVSYELNAYSAEPNRMNRTYSELHQNIQDEFTAAAIEIMSPAYEAHRDGSASTVPARPAAADSG